MPGKKPRSRKRRKPRATRNRNDDHAPLIIREPLLTSDRINRHIEFRHELLAIASAEVMQITMFRNSWVSQRPQVASVSHQPALRSWQFPTLATAVVASSRPDSRCGDLTQGDYFHEREEADSDPCKSSHIASRTSGCLQRHPCPPRVVDARDTNRSDSGGSSQGQRL